MNHPLQSARIEWADREGGFFMNWEEQARDLMKSETGKSLESLMNSEIGTRLAQSLDGAAVEQAARSGDPNVLSALLRNILETPEGKVFAEQVRKTVKHGQ